MKPIVILIALGGFLTVAGSGYAANHPPQPISAEASPLDNMDAGQIPDGERFAWQPKELVAVIGSHRWRHWGQVIAVAFSPDGKTIASGGWDGAVRLWDHAGQELAALDTPAFVNALAFSPDGKLLLAGGEDGTIRAWKLTANPPVPLALIKPSARPYSPMGPPLESAVDAIAFAPGGKLLANSVGRQAGVRVVLWDSTTWPPRELPPLPGTLPPKEFPYQIPSVAAPFAFSSDGKTFFTQERAGNIAVWDVSSGQVKQKALGKLNLPRNQMLAMAISPDGKTLATCHGDDVTFHIINRGQFGRSNGDVILWDLAATPPKPRAAFGAFKDDSMFWMTAAAAFSPDGKTLAFAAQQRRVELWDVTAKEPKKREVLPGNVGQAGTLAFSADGKALASVGEGAVLLWDLRESPPRLTTSQSPQFPLAVVSPDGRRLATVEEATKKFAAGTRLWDLTGTAPQPLTGFIDGAPLFFASDGFLVTAEFRDAGPPKPGNPIQARLSALRRWDVSGRAPRPVAAAATLPGASFRPIQQGIGGVVTARTLLLGEIRQGEVRLCRLGMGGEARLCTIPVPRESNGLGPEAASSDGTVFAAGVGDWSHRIIKVWDIAGSTARERAALTALVGAPSALALAPDGQAIALADNSGTIQVWGLAKHTPRLRATLREAAAQGPAFSGEGRAIASAPPGIIRRVAFSCDGQQLVTIGSERKLVVWDIPGAKALYTATLPTADMVDAGFTPDGRHVVTTNPDGTIYILRLPHSSLMQANNKLDDARLEHLKETQLQTLNLKSSRVTDARLRRLKGLTKLESLDLSETKVTDAGLQNLKELPQLQTLDLSETEITDAGLEHLKDLSQLQTLDLSDTKVTDAGLKYLEGLAALLSLNLTGTKITDAALRRLKGLARLQSLNLSETDVTDAGLENLKGLTALRSLKVSHTKITDAGLDYLKALTKLPALDLSQTAVTDAGLQHLKRLKKLRTLDLMDTGVTDSGVKKLQQTLPRCRILSSFPQSAVAAGGAGRADSEQQKAMADIQRFGGWASTDMTRPDRPSIVISVNLGNSRITDAGLESVKGLTELESLDLSRTEVTGTGLGRLQGLTELQSLNLLGTKVTDAGLQHLKQLPQLESLNLGQTQVTDAGLQHLDGLKDLQSLDLTATKITDAGLQHLQGLTNLRSLNLTAAKITDAGLEYLEGLAKLRSLALFGTKVTGAGLERLKGLEELYLSGTKVTDAGLKHLEGLAKLQSLGLSGTKVTDAGLKHLEALTKLQSLDLRQTQVTGAGLEHLKGLEYLSLPGTKVTDTGLKHLEALTKLQSLDLGQTQVTDAGLAHLKGLCQLQTLQLYQTKVTGAGMEHLQGLTQLQFLRLWGTGMTGAGLEHLSGLPQLQFIDLQQTKVNDAGLENLKGLTKLNELNLRDTKVTDAGAKKLHQALPNCRIFYNGGAANGWPSPRILMLGPGTETAPGR